MQTLTRAITTRTAGTHGSRVHDTVNAAARYSRPAQLAHTTRGLELCAARAAALVWLEDHAQRCDRPAPCCWPQKTLLRAVTGLRLAASPSEAADRRPTGRRLPHASPRPSCRRQ